MRAAAACSTLGAASSLRLLALLVCGSIAVGASKPSVIFLLADDLGYNEMGFMNSTRGLITPHLDSLASNGVILRNYYVQPICSPTRSSLMTGRYTIRLGTQSNVVWWDSPWGVPLNETFLPQNLQDAGYVTAMFGKWHLGMFQEAYTPARRGFHEHMGYYQGCESRYTHVAACCTEGSPSHDQNFTCAALSVDGINATQRGSEFALGYDWWKTGPAPNAGTSRPDLTANHTSSAVLIRDAAVDFIARAASQPQPFFLYLPFQNVHDPYTVDERYREMYSTALFTDDERTLFGYITEMDDAVGAVNAALNASGAYANSITVFSSDNGAPGSPLGALHKRTPAGRAPGYIARNYPYRGTKAHVWEGGVRVPGFVHSPLLPAAVRGTTSDGLFHVTDWLPTLVGIAGGSTARNLPLDGLDIWGDLQRGGSASPRSELLLGLNPLGLSTDWFVGGLAGPPRAALRVGDFKLLTWGYAVAGIAGANATGPLLAPAGTTGADQEFTKGVVLYDLRADEIESTNLAHQPEHARRLESMLARLRQLAEEQVHPMTMVRPFQGPHYFCAECPQHPASGFQGDFAKTPWGPWM